MKQLILLSKLRRCLKNAAGTGLQAILLFFGMLLLSVSGFSQYVQITHTTGTAAYGGVNVTVSEVTPGTYASTCTPAQHYQNFAPGASWSFTFSSPVASVRIPHINSPGGSTTTTQFIVNGVPYTLTGANITGLNNQCTDATPNVIVGGDLTNTGAETGFPNSQIDIPGPITSLQVVQTTGLNTGAFQVSFPPCSPTSPHPAIIAVTGGGGYCFGGAGVNIGLAGSAVGIDYQLYRGATPVGSPVAGIGAALSFGLQTVAGSYTVIATNASTGCSSNMAGSASVVIYPLPNIYTVTGGGSFCAGGTGVAIGLSGSDVGINYQLYLGGLPVVGTIVAGTGGPISFGSRTTPGTYTVVARNGGFTGCTNNMSGSATITVNPLPSVFSVTGGGSYCAGGTGVAVGLSNSTTGVQYQLYRGTAPVGAPVTGTGSALSFGLQTLAGAYTVRAYDPATSCTNNMSGSVSVNIIPMPVIYNVIGGGGYCAGGVGAVVRLSGSNSGINYQLYLGGSPVGSSVAGTGSVISFGPQSVAGVYTVVATETSTGCTSNMNGSVTVSIIPLPNVYTVTGGGAYCGGTAGLPVGLSGSDAGVVYQLYRGTTMGGGTVGGTGSAITFGLQTIGGTYTVLAYNPATGCSQNMTGSAVITVVALPAPVTVTGGGGYCTGGGGVNVGLAASSIGVNYQLYLGATPVGSPVAGTGTALSFGLQTTAGTYTATGTSVTSGCTNNMTGSVNVYVYPLPTAFTMAGGGGYCAGGAGLPIYLTGSQTGVTYQLYLGGLPVVGAVVAGTGGAISFGPRTAAGVYTVLATVGTTTCSQFMTGSITITINPLPTAFTVTGGGGYCLGGTGVHIYLSSSQTGVNYQLYYGTVAVGAPLAGTGTVLDFGLLTSAGVYKVVATDATTGCTSTMTGTVNVIINSLPFAFAVTGGGSYCPGGVGVYVGLAGTTAGTTYQLFNSAGPVGSPVTGTGTAISFGLQTIASTYTVVATSTITGCVNNMTGSAVVSIAPLPLAFTVTGGGGYCVGATGVHVWLASSSTGVVYQLYRGTAGVGSPLAGTGTILDFGLQTIAGTYTVVATATGTLCTNNMTGSVVVTVNPLPAQYPMAGGGAYCAGGSGVPVYLSNSQTGVNYQLYRGTTPVGTPVAGTGSAIPFGLQTVAGSYTVIATNATTGCVSSMTGVAVVSVISLPTAFTVTGGGGYCVGGTGRPVYLSGSQTGVNYQLLLGTSPVGTPIGGTGAAIAFGLQTAAGIYSVVATTATGGCTTTMTGSATVTINPLPTVYTVSGGGSMCTGGSGIPVYLIGSQTGVNYQLYRGTTAVGTPLAGTGTALAFGPQSVSGTYTVVATNPTTGCTSNMSGSAVVVVGSLPAIVSVTGGGGYCAGGTGVHIGLAASAVGISYQLYLGTTPVGSPVAGTGAALDFGLQTTAGTYTAVGTFTSTSCSSNMSGSATVYVYAVPTAYTVSGGGSYCTGGTGVHIYLTGSNTGVTYKVYRSGTPVTGSVAGTGTAMDFGLFTVAGTYTIVATNGYGCTTTMTGSATVSINALPTISGSIYTVMPGASITLSGSPAGGTFTSSAIAIATVAGSTGVVTGVSLGTAVITYTASTGCFAAHTVAVTSTGFRAAPGAAQAASAVSSLTVVPNPSKGIFAVKGALAADNDADVYMQVTDIAGRVVYSKQITALNGKLDEEINLGNAANGMYLLSLRSEGGQQVFHIVVEQ